MTTPADAAKPEPHPLGTPQRLYLWLTAVFVTSLLVADLIGSKLFLFHVGSWDLEHSVGMLPFPITFLLTDLLNEYYGPKAARRVTWIAFSMAAFCFVLLAIGQAMPVSPHTALSQEMYVTVFGSARAMYVASLAAFICGQMTDIAVFTALKRATGNRLLWLRSTGSTIVSQMIDSFVVTFIFFQSLDVLGDGSPVTMGFILRTAATGYVLKFLIAIGLTPIIYVGHRYLHVAFGLKPYVVGEAA